MGLLFIGRLEANHISFVEATTHLDQLKMPLKGRRGDDSVTDLSVQLPT